MNILFTLCGRAGSKGVKSKNILDFCGFPLPYYSLAAIKLFCAAHGAQYERLDCALSTDSAPLTAMLQRVDGALLCIDRDAALAGDTVRKIDVIRDASKRAEAHFQARYDMTVDLDITAPLRTLADLENVVRLREAASPDVDVIFTVTEARRSPYFNMVEKKGVYYDRVLPSDFATRQEAPALYDMNASIYAYTRDFIYDENPFFNRASIALMKDTGILDIDGEWDYRLMQGIAAYLYETDAEYRAVRDCAARLGQ